MEHTEHVEGTQPRRPSMVEQNGDTIYIRTGITWTDATDENTGHWTYTEDRMSVTERDALREGRLHVETDALRTYERQLLHEETDGDVNKARRMIDVGDTAHDWQGWLDTLNAYNVAVTATKDQPGYPREVTYPERPVRPW